MRTMNPNCLRRARSEAGRHPRAAVPALGRRRARCCACSHRHQGRVCERAGERRPAALEHTASRRCVVANHPASSEQCGMGRASGSGGMARVGVSRREGGLAGTSGRAGGLGVRHGRSWASEAHPSSAAPDGRSTSEERSCGGASGTLVQGEELGSVPPVNDRIHSCREVDALALLLAGFVASSCIARHLRCASPRPP